MYLVIKRFGCDDVPVFLTDDRLEAEREAAKIEATIDTEERFATQEDESLMQVGIGHELASVGIITFGCDGRPVPDGLSLFSRTRHKR